MAINCLENERGWSESLGTIGKSDGGPPAVVPTSELAWLLGKCVALGFSMYKVEFRTWDESSGRGVRRGQSHGVHLSL